MRDDDFCTLFTSDSTQITRLDKLVERWPELYKVIETTDYGKTYKFPKRLVSFRNSITTRENFDEGAFQKRSESFGIYVKSSQKFLDK